MIKIGILGSDNSHALAFAKLCNLPDAKTGGHEYDDVRVTHIYGHSDEENQNVAYEGKVANIVKDPQEMMGAVDAVMVVFRHGDLHARYALPFIRAGIPTWIDKPFTIDIEEAKLLIAQAEKKGTLLTGGSTCKYAYDVLLLKNAVEENRLGKIVSGMLNFPIKLNSEYGGVHFYGPHLVEMAMQIFGDGIRSVKATVKGENAIVIARYEDYDIVLNYAANAQESTGIIIGEERNLVREIDKSMIYKQGFEKFIQMIRTGKRPFELDKLLIATAVVNAIEKSINTGEEVMIDDCY
ncbi:MAG: Gfo/Idh/MocA family protein [Christensenellales bacterium]|jgi:predicted dehydrogenase